MGSKLGIKSELSFSCTSHNEGKGLGQRPQVSIFKSIKEMRKFNSKIVYPKNNILAGPSAKASVFPSMNWSPLQNIRTLF